MKIDAELGLRGMGRAQLAGRLLDAQRDLATLQAKLAHLENERLSAQRIVWSLVRKMGGSARVSFEEFADASVPTTLLQVKTSPDGMSIAAGWEVKDDASA